MISLPKPLMFLDTETTGLHPERDEVWEIGAILRATDGTEKRFHAFVDHSPDLCGSLPEQFLDDHRKRYPIDCRTGERTDWGGHWWSRSNAVEELIDFSGLVAPVLVGAVPGFDTERVGRLIYRTQGPFTRMPWHYHVQDVETLAAGYLKAKRKFGPYREGEIEAALQLPFDSELLSKALGVDPEKYDRHTAMGDAEWVRDQWDAVWGTTPAS